MIKNDDDLRAFYASIAPIPDQLLINWTERLKSGERGAAADGIARQILKDFQIRVWLNKPQSDVTLGWLSTAFEKLLDYADVQEAIGLSRRKNARPANGDAAVLIAWWVQATIKRGYSKSEAIELAVERFARDTKTIQRAVSAGASWVPGMNPNNDWGEFFMLQRPSRPLPPFKDKK